MFTVNTIIYLGMSLALMLMTIAYVGAFKRKFEEMLPVSIFTVMLIIYGFGYFGMLKIGAIVVIGASAIGFIISLSKNIACKTNKEMAGKTFSFGFFVFVGIVVLAYIVTANALANGLADGEWVETLKRMLAFGEIRANVGAADVTRVAFQPGVALLAYPFVLFMEAVDPATVMAVSNIFVLSLLLPIFSKLKWKQCIISILILPLVFLLPWLMPNELAPINTMTPYIGTAVLAAYALYVYFSNEQTVYTYYALGLASAVLCLMQPGSEAFAIMIFLLVLIDIIFIKHSDFGGLTKKPAAFLMPVFYILITAAAIVSWRLAAFAEFKGQVYDVLSLAALKTESFTTIFTRFKYYLIVADPESAISLAPVLWLAVAAVIALVAILFAKGGRERIRMTVYSFLIFVGFAAYSMMVTLTYTCAFNTEGGTVLPHVEPFVYTYILMALIFFTYMLEDRIFVRFKGFGRILAVIPVLVLLYFAPFKVMMAQIFPPKEDTHVSEFIDPNVLNETTE